MIIYNPKKWCGWKVLCSKSGCSGSVAPRAALYGLVAALIAFIIKLDQEFEWGVFSALHHTTREQSLFDHPYSLHIWGAALGFMLVFRGNLGYARHWEGRREIGRMSSYLQDVAMNAVCYDEANKDMNQYREWKQVRPPAGRPARSMRASFAEHLCGARRSCCIWRRCCTRWRCSACGWTRTWTT